MAKLPFNSMVFFMHKRFLTTSPALYASFSSSSSSSSSTLSSPSYTTQFLVKSCGLSLDSVTSISQKLNLDEKKRVRHESVIEYLKSEGFSNTHIAKLVSSFPLVLQSKIDRMKLKIEYLHANGFVGPALPKLIVSNPNILRRSLDKHIKPSIDFLKEFLDSEEKIVAAIKRGSWLLSYDLKGTLKPNVSHLMKEGVPRGKISQLITLYPRTILQSVDRMVRVTERIKMLGIKPTDAAYISAFPVILSMEESIWERKVKLYKEFGLSETEISKVFKRLPLFMACSEKKIKKLMDFYMNTMKLKPSTVVSYPWLLLYSFDARIRPRFKVLNILTSKKLLKTDKKMAWLIGQNEATFLKNYVIKYLDHVPDLMEQYCVIKKIDA